MTIAPKTFSSAGRTGPTTLPKRLVTTPMRTKLMAMPATIRAGRERWSSAVPARMMGRTGSTQGLATLASPAPKVSAMEETPTSMAFQFWTSWRTWVTDWMPGVALRISLPDASVTIRVGRARMPYCWNLAMSPATVVFR